MMKHILNIKSQFLVLVVFLIFTTCVNDDDYNIPNLNIDKIYIPEDHITTFKAIVSLLEQAQNNGDAIAIINADESLYIEGYVISSDKAGSFFEELIIQNKIDDSNPDEDPRLGLKIEINTSNLSDTYEIGRKVYVKMNGLTIGESGGVIVIGKGDGSQVNQIQASEYKDIIIRSTDLVTIKPKVTALPLSDNDKNTLIQLENMQINRFELGRTFASEAIDEFDGFRIMESCVSGVSLVLQTSTFSDFKTLVVPEDKGTVTGIYSRDFGDDFNVFIINSSADINFTEKTRCDPIELDCELVNTVGDSNLFYEDFESQTNNRVVEINGWTNYIEAGSEGWEGYSSTSSNASLGRSARVQSASSGDESNITWLVTPGIDLNTYNNVTLRFKTSNSLADSSFMEVLYSLDWDGTEANIVNATWGVLSNAYVVKDTDSFVPWFNSGTINLSCVTGTMHIAFKYTGSGMDNFDGIYELDEISVDYASQ